MTHGAEWSIGVSSTGTLQGEASQQASVRLSTNEETQNDHDKRKPSRQ